MKYMSLVGRSIALSFAVALAMPWGSVASSVLGGTGNCDTSKVVSDGADCADKPGGNACSAKKDQCSACVDETSMGIKCGDGSAACGSAQCAPNQKNSQDSGESCIEQPCGHS